MLQNTVVKDNRKRRSIRRSAVKRIKPHFNWMGSPIFREAKVAAMMYFERRDPSIVLSRSFGGYTAFGERMCPVMERLYPKEFLEACAHFGSREDFIRCWYERGHKGFNEHSTRSGVPTGVISKEHYTKSVRLLPHIEDAQRKYDL